LFFSAILAVFTVKQSGEPDFSKTMGLEIVSWLPLVL
jgi:hypothetical protein